MEAMFDTLIGKPLFNLLTFIYGVLPGHNFGLAIVLFTVVIRLLLWPLLKKQLHNAAAMRRMQPELKRIKKEAKGDRVKESELTMQLYKETGINPLGSIGTALLQLPILLALFHGITKIVGDKSAVVTNSYGFIQNLPWMKELASNIDKFDMTLLGFVDLARKPMEGSLLQPFSAHYYWPGVVIVILSAVVQYYASKMLMVTDTQARSLRKILKDASSGVEADQAEVNAATMRGMRYLIPAMILLTSIHFSVALGLYWLVSGFIQYVQQRHILSQDATELGVSTATVEGRRVEAEVIPPKKAKAQKHTASTKRRKK
jgi:YidC/Oxa1 family membrane protein insertase